MLKDSVTCSNWASRRAKEISLSGRPRIGSQTERSAWAKVSSASPGGRYDVNLGQAPVVAVECGEQHVGQITAGAVVEPAHDAEVHGDDVARFVDGHVARVLVAVEEAVAEHLLEKDAGGLGQHLGGVVAGGD
jgi:hypothetical protein